MRHAALLLALSLALTTSVASAQSLIMTDGFESGDTSAWSSVFEVPLAGFAEISGPCGFLTAAVLDSATPSFFSNVIDFADDPYDDTDFDQLTAGGQKIIVDDDTGGSSLLSEVFAFEVLARCELAVLLKTGGEIVYLDPQGEGSDFLVEVQGFKLGVQVTRAVAYPFDEPYTVQQATDLLSLMLADILASSANVAPVDEWRKQILSVVAYGTGHRDSLETAWTQLEPALKADTIVIVTVTDGDDGFLY